MSEKVFIDIEFFPLYSEYKLFNFYNNNFSINDTKDILVYNNIKELMCILHKYRFSQKVRMFFDQNITINQFIKRLEKVTNVKITDVYYKNIYSPNKVYINQYFLGNIQFRYVSCVQVIFTF